MTTYSFLAPTTPTGRNEAEAVWAEGKTIWDYTPRIPDWRTKDPSQMSLAELVATQNQELPSTSKITWSLGLEGTLSMDRTSSNEDDDTDNMLEAEAAYEEWAANRASEHLGMTPYTQFPPDLANRIQWERMRFYSSDAVKMRLQMKGTTPSVQILGLKLDPEQYTKVAKRYLKKLLDMGHTPDDIVAMAKIQNAKDKINDLRQEAMVEMPEGWYEEVFLGAYHLENHPNRDNFLDLDLHGAHEEYTELDDEEETLVEMGFQVDREILIKGARQPLRTLSPVARERALWHGTIGEQSEIGHHWTREDNYQNDEDTPTTLTTAYDPTGTAALGALRD